MSTEPAKPPSPWLFWLALVATAYNLFKLVVPGAEPESSTLFTMRLIFTALCMPFLIVTALKWFRSQR